MAATTPCLQRRFQPAPPNHGTAEVKGDDKRFVWRNRLSCWRKKRQVPPMKSLVVPFVVMTHPPAAKCVASLTIASPAMPYRAIRQAVACLAAACPQ